MGWCSGTGKDFMGLGCSNEPRYCYECHAELVKDAITIYIERQCREYDRVKEEHRKEMILHAVEFANWYGEYLGNHDGSRVDAVFHYDKWLKEKK